MARGEGGIYHWTQQTYGAAAAITPKNMLQSFPSFPQWVKME
jgi:hypothetical protein